MIIVRGTFPLQCLIIDPRLNVLKPLQLHSMHIDIPCPRQLLHHRFTCLHMLYTNIIHNWQDHSFIMSRKIFRVQYSLYCKVLPLPFWMNQTLIGTCFPSNSLHLVPLDPLYMKDSSFAMLYWLCWICFPFTFLADKQCHTVPTKLHDEDRHWRRKHFWKKLVLRAWWYWLYLICFLFIFLNHSFKFPSHWFMTTQCQSCLFSQRNCERERKWWGSYIKLMKWQAKR